MGKKLTKVLVLAVAMLFVFSSVAMAAMPNGTVVLGDKAFDLNYANNPANGTEIDAAYQQALVTANGKVYIKDFAGNLVDNATQSSVSSSVLPQVTYKDANGNVKVYAPHDGDEVTEPGELKVESVSAINLRQLEVKFNNSVDPTSAQDLNNYYIGLVNETTGDVQYNSIEKLAGASWEATLAEDNKTITISSTDGKLLTDAADSSHSGGEGGLGLKLNEIYYLQVRNVKDANGKFTDVQEKSQVLTDNVRPTAKLEKNTIPNTEKLTILFSEPVKPGTTTIYMDGNKVASVASSVADAVYDKSVAEASKITVDITSSGLKLDNGSHKVALVGTKDLNDNLISPNPVEFGFTVVDPTATKAPKPEVKSVTQVADNAFKILFTTNDVRPVDSDTVVTVKDAVYSDSGYSDLTISGNSIISSETEEGTQWLVVIDAAKDFAAGALSYRNANVITKDIVIENFYNDNGTSATSDDTAGDRTTKSLQFKKDTVAPVLDPEKPVTAAGAVLTVHFIDPPFTTDGNGTVKLQAGQVEVKYVDENSVTHSQAVTPNSTSDNKGINLEVTDEGMLNAKGELIAGGNYTIVLPDGIVTDDEETVAEAVYGYKLLDGQHPFVGKTISYTIPGTPDQVTGVPQTTKGLINSVEDVKNAATGTYQEDVKTYFGNDAKNKILVQFDGDVDGTTAKNLANYTLNGKPFPAGTEIEYRIADITGDNNAEKFVVITLPKETIAYSGSYDFTVSGVANKDGNKMLPVSDTVMLTDNVAPVAESVTVPESNKVKVRFSENIKLADGATEQQAANNFKVTANGKVLSVSQIVFENNYAVLTLADNFDNNGSLDVPVTVVVTPDSNGNMFIVDNEGNKAATVTVSR